MENDIIHYYIGGNDEDERYVRCQVESSTGVTPIALVGGGWRSDELLAWRILIEEEKRISVPVDKVWEFEESLREGKIGPAKMTEASYREREISSPAKTE